jgi:hypothetical protein
MVENEDKIIFWGIFIDKEYFPKEARFRGSENKSIPIFEKLSYTHEI